MVRAGAGELHVEFRRSDSGLRDPAKRKLVTADTEAAQLGLDSTRIAAKVDERRDRHIAADARERLEVEDSHGHSASALINALSGGQPRTQRTSAKDRPFAGARSAQTLSNALNSTSSIR